MINKNFQANLLVAVNTQFCTYDLIKEDEWNDHSCTQNFIIALHALICSLHHKYNLEILTVATVYPTRPLEPRVKAMAPMTKLPTIIVKAISLVTKSPTPIDKTVSSITRHLAPIAVSLAIGSLTPVAEAPDYWRRSPK